MEFSRRNFLQNAGAITTLALVHPADALAVQGNDQPKGRLPEPIAKLKSRRSEATPITTAEREQRQERARQLMGRTSWMRSCSPAGPRWFTSPISIGS